MKPERLNVIIIDAVYRSLTLSSLLFTLDGMYSHVIIDIIILKTSGDT